MENSLFGELLKDLIGKSDNTEQSAETPTPSPIKPNIISTEEVYRLPIRVGKDNQTINEKNPPWIVGNFTGAKPSDHNHPEGHWGQDLRAQKGTPIYPIASGVIKAAGFSPAKSGNWVSVLHEEGRVQSFYAHLEKINVTSGQKVTQETVIGTVGASGNARGVFHVHWETKINGSYTDPSSVLGKRVGSLTKKAELQLLLDNIFVLAAQFEFLNRS